MPIKHALVRDLARELNGGAEVFRRHKIDYYRIGGLQLWQAAARQGCDLDALARTLSELPSTSGTVPTRTRDLVAFIQKRYRTLHQNQLFAAIKVAHRVEARQGYAAGSPQGVARLLKVIFEDLETHGLREGNGLFQAIERRPGGNYRFPVMRMMLEHDEFSDQLDTLARLTNDYTPPQGADDDWRALYALCEVFDRDLRYHMHLENNLLFPRFVDDRVLAS